jgi:glycogen phosphorylase
MSSTALGRLPRRTRVPPQDNTIEQAAISESELAELKSAVLAHLALSVGKNPSHATDRDWFVAAALTIRDRLVHRWLDVDRAEHGAGSKRVYYLSLEFLVGRLFSDVLCNLGLTELFNTALGDLGVNLARLRAQEPDAALGNGGLGRLAACFMDSMASLGIPAYGYGIRYDHGLFRQVIRDGVQLEYPEEWLSFGNPWEFERPEVSYDVHFGGWVEQTTRKGVLHTVWHPNETVEAVAFDTPIAGWRGRHVNPLRLWSARAADPLRLDTFNSGDHTGALYEQTRAEAISKVLYPSDESAAGRELRLRQEYFFVSASLQDLLKRHLYSAGDLHSLADCASIQLNDTHPSIAVAELMRLLLDVHGLPWDEAWEITVGTLSYTNHTLLPEALERWPLGLFERILPRHLEIIYRINIAHLDLAKQVDPSEDFQACVSLIDEQDGRHVRMGHVAFVGSHKVNGVSALHTQLLRETVFRELNAIYPDRIVNKTNGITFRRWLYQCNPKLTSLLREVCGEQILDHPEGIVRLAAHCDDSAVRDKLYAVKQANKVALSRIVNEHLGFRINPAAIFDVQIKRIHEYKRQLLNILETVALYFEMRANPDGPWAPRVKIFSGKAAASYTRAKLIIKLINDVAEIINRDPVVRDKLAVAFLPNYNVSLAEAIIPAADLSEQISTAGTEASGTGNMKLALNGALTIGTLDGANIEIRDHVGDENIFIFGLRAHEAHRLKREGFDADAAIAASPMLSQAIDAISLGMFSPDDPARFAPIVEGLRYNDPYLIVADFASYYETQRRVDALWRRREDWLRASALNIAHMAWFSSDRTIAEYAEDIWRAPVRR